MHFEWYNELNNCSDLTQGDIITCCPIPIPNKSIYQAIIDNKDEADEPIEGKSADLIILSQACDILNEKIESLVLCPIWKLNELIDANDYYKGNKARESLRQGKEPAYHLLNYYSSNSISLDYSIVDFHQIYSIPKSFLKEVTKNIPVRLRLLPPYREHLSQAFARYFMRVGLPVDISKEEIKNYQKS